MNQQDVYNRIEAHFRTNQERFTKRFSRYFNNRERGEDVVSECYVRALTYWSTAPEEEQHFEAWLRTILNNCGKNNHKEEAHRGATNNSEVEEEGEEKPVVPTVIVKEVETLIAEKDQPTQVVLRLALFEGWKHSSIAEVTPFKVQSVRNMVFKFRQEVRDRYRIAV